MYYINNRLCEVSSAERHTDPRIVTAKKVLKYYPGFKLAMYSRGKIQDPRLASYVREKRQYTEVRVPLGSTPRCAVYLRFDDRGGRVPYDRKEHQRLVSVLKEITKDS